MFAKLKQLFNPGPARDEPEDNQVAETISAELIQLESGLQQNPADGAIQKQLMVKYNQAIKVYSANRNYRNRVDDIFVKMDDLRNTIRRNI